MKRGLISWDKSEISVEVFEQRIARVRTVLAERDLPALVVYSDLWRSNQARFLTNFMPYFNRALLVIPRDMPPTLLCGLSPRVYGWIRSVTTIDDIRPAGNFAKPLFDLARERQWSRIGALDLERFPYDLHTVIHRGSIDLVNVESAAVFALSDDDTELSIRRKTVGLAKQILEQEILNGVGLTDHEFVGRLERRFRKAGAEDLIVLLTNGRSVPGPATGATLEEHFSVSVAVEYRGHWIRITRPHGAVMSEAPESRLMEKLDGAYPYEFGEGDIQAAHLEFRHKGKRLFYGDTAL